MRTTNERIAIVTGGSGGIGRAVAERLAVAGLTVAVHYNANELHATDVVATIRGHRGQAIAVPGDIADVDAMTALFDRVSAEYGGVDVVVNTAGVMELAPLSELSMNRFDRMHRINVRGTFVVSKLAGERVRSGGAIVNFSSSVTRLALPTYAAYSATKGAVEMMTPILAKELRGRDITVNAVAPGPTATPLFLDGKDDETIERLASMPPLSRLGQPDDIAETVAHLATTGRWINGQIIYVNGGII